MPDAVILQFRQSKTIDCPPAPEPAPVFSYEAARYFNSPLVLFPAELWPSEPAVSSQCGRSCSPDDCDAPRCYQR
jgi:hypothetical protein